MSNETQYQLSPEHEREVQRFAEATDGNGVPIHSSDEVLNLITQLGEADQRQREKREQQAKMELDEQVAAQTLNELSNRVQQEWVMQNPWFPLEPSVRKVNADMLWERAQAVCINKTGRNLGPESYSQVDLDQFCELLRRCLEKAARQLWEEKRFYGIDWSAPHLHTPYSEFHGRTQMDEPDQQSREKQEAEAEAMDLDTLRDAANKQMAEQNRVDNPGDAVDIAEARRRADARGEGIRLTPGWRSPLLDQPDGGETVSAPEPAPLNRSFGIVPGR